MILAGKLQFKHLYERGPKMHFDEIRTLASQILESFRFDTGTTSTTSFYRE